MHEIVFYIKPPRVPTLCLECLDEETHTVLDLVTSAVSVAQHSVLEKGNVVCSPSNVVCSHVVGRPRGGFKKRSIASVR